MKGLSRDTKLVLADQAVRALAYGLGAIRLGYSLALLHMRGAADGSRPRRDRRRYRVRLGHGGSSREPFRSAPQLRALFAWCQRDVAHAENP